MRYVSFSLKTIFIATAAIAFFGYRVFPFPIEIHCDRMGGTRAGQVDILGRDQNQKFQTLLKNVEVTYPKRSADTARGSTRVEVTISLYNKQRLEKYDILCIRESK